MGFEYKKYPLVSVPPDDCSYLTYRTYLESADLIPGWRAIGKNRLADLYIDNEGNEQLRDSYFSALMLRYWGVVNMYLHSSRSLRVDSNECATWLAESIMRAMKYRRWRDPSNKMYGNPDAPDIIIRQCIWTTRQKYYHDANRSNRKSDYMTFSMDTDRRFSDGPDGKGRFPYEDEGFGKTDSRLTYEEISQYYADMGLVAHSVVSDALFSGDFIYAGGHRYSKGRRIAVDYKRMVSYFRKTDEGILSEYYLDKFGIDPDQLGILLGRYRNMKPVSLRNQLSGVVADIRTSPKVREFLCW